MVNMDVAHAQSRFLYFKMVIKCIGLLAVVAFELRKMPTNDCKIVVIFNINMCTLYKAYTYVSKSCVAQCLKAPVSFL